jgi:hypothetical protein
MTTLRWVLAWTSALSTLTFAWRTEAQGAQAEPAITKRTGLELAARGGYGIPIGEAQQGEQLEDDIKSQIPVQLDVGYRESERWTFGLYFSYGFGSTGRGASELCRSLSASCPTQVVRGGIQILFHIAPKKPIGGWLSTGIGFERLGFALNSNAFDVHYSGYYVGIEALSFQAGLDIRHAAGASFGPFVGALSGRYIELSTECTGTGCRGFSGANASLDEPTLHNWLVLGLRGAFLL